MPDSTESLQLRTLLFECCLQHARLRLRDAEEQLASALESGNSETKSTAGDKHETSRALAQIEQEKAALRKSEAIRLHDELLRKQPVSAIYKEVRDGCVVVTDKNSFYILAAAGKIEVNGAVYFAISADSPLARALMGKKKGESLSFNGTSYTIRDIF